MQKRIEIDIPYRFTARNYQIPFLQAMTGPNALKRACIVWHRRAGKGKTVLNFTIQKMLEKPGTYFHLFPEYTQGKKILWDGTDKQGFKFIDHFPKELVKKKNETELKIELTNGSIWQIGGADTYDKLVGTNPIGIVLDEWAISDKYPQAWELLRPILAENGGWAVFCYTPRGRNHGFDLYQNAMNNPDWFCQMLTVKDTQAISTSDIDEERRAGMSEDMINQEFYCSFLSANSNVLIPFELIQAALDRDIYYGHSPKIAGLDVARFGDDRTALIVRQGGAISYVETWGKADVVETTGRVLDRFKGGLFGAIAVDSIGVGGGVADLLKSHGVPTAMVQVSESAKDQMRFDKQRDELWWRLREWFEEGACVIPRSLQPQLRQSMIKDIQDIHFGYSPAGRIKIESKDEMKKRLGFSPDIGDALCLTFTPKIQLRAHKEHASRETFQFSNMQRRKQTYDGSYQEVRT